MPHEEYLMKENKNLTRFHVIRAFLNRPTPKNCVFQVFLKLGWFLQYVGIKDKIQYILIFRNSYQRYFLQFMPFDPQIPMFPHFCLLPLNFYGVPNQKLAKVRKAADIIFVLRRGLAMLSKVRNVWGIKTQ